MVYDHVSGKAVLADNSAATVVEYEEYETDVVQFLASEHGYTAVPVHERARVLCFCTGDKDSKTDPYVRVNVFCKVGTIGMVVYPLRCGKPTQLFRRGITDRGCSMKEVQHILENPRGGAGYENAGSRESNAGGTHGSCCAPGASPSKASKAHSAASSQSIRSFVTQQGISETSSSYRASDAGHDSDVSNVTIASI